MKNQCTPKNTPSVLGLRQLKHAMPAICEPLRLGDQKLKSWNSPNR